MIHHRMWQCVAMWLTMALVSATPAFAAGKGPGAVRKQAEMSMVVTGQVRISADGRVDGVRIDRESEIPKAVADLIRQNVPQWRFEPLAAPDAAVETDTPMTLRVVARRLYEQDGEAYEMRLGSAHFGRDEASHLPRQTQMQPPTYPELAARSNVSGRVYMVARIGRDGRVEDAFAEQVNLNAVGSETQMKRFRELLAQSTLTTARQWQFAPPTQGPYAGEAHWVVRVPVAYELKRDKPPAYGHWDLYIPGPRQRAPWIDADRDTTAGVDAFGDERMQSVGRGRRLLTPIDRNS